MQRLAQFMHVVKLSMYLPLGRCACTAMSSGQVLGGLKSRHFAGLTTVAQRHHLKRKADAAWACCSTRTAAQPAAAKTLLPEQGEAADAASEDPELDDAGAFDTQELLDEAEADMNPELDTSGTDWGTQGLQAAQTLLQQPQFEQLDLFSFKAIQRNKRLDIRLDKLDDQYGSPSLDDVIDFTRALDAELERILGPDLGGMELEVSSAGAERIVRLPGDLKRFAELPMRVSFVDANGRTDHKILKLVSLSEDLSSTEWQLADVRANRGKGKAKLSKTQLSNRFSFAIAALKKVNLYIEA